MYKQHYVEIFTNVKSLIFTFVFSSLTINVRGYHESIRKQCIFLAKVR